jgi:hypothetical protein
MGQRNGVFSIGNVHVLGGMLLIGWMACGPESRGAAANPDPENGKSRDAPMQLRADPLLQKPVTGEFRNPKAQDFVDLVRNETGQRISLAPDVIQDRPIQGDTKISKTPAWAVLENLARNQYIKGRWIKDGDEYVLVPSYTGKPPPLPPQLPPQLRKAMDRAEKGIPPDPDPNAIPPSDTARRIWLTGASTVLLLVLGAVVFWRHRAGVRAAAEKDKPKEKSE